jgi:hypothetical protein
LACISQAHHICYRTGILSPFWREVDKLLPYGNITWITVHIMANIPDR